MSYAPPGWANTTTPAFGGVLCGNVEQDTTYTTTSTTPEPIGFQSISSWSDTQSLTTEDGFTWTCNLSGIYNLRCNQTLAVTNNYTPPTADTVIVPNTTFYLDLAETTEAPATGTLGVAYTDGAETTLTHTSVAVEEDVDMGSFGPPPGFITSLTIPGGEFDLVVRASTTGTGTGGLATQPVYIGQYYKTTQQNAPSGTTSVTFDGTASWNNTNGYITHTNGTTDFVCQQAGLYQLELNLAILANSSTWTNLSKAIGINITRIGVTEQQILRNIFNVSASVSWSNSLVGTVRLEAGDVIECVVNQTLASGTALIQCLQDTFDYNTTFTFKVIEELPNTVQGMNSIYYNIYTIEEGDPQQLIFDGSSNPTVLSSTETQYYHIKNTIPPIKLNTLTERILIKVFANFYTASDVVLYFRGDSVPTIQTTVSQEVVATIPPTTDVVDVRITVQSSTSELDQIFVTSVPISAVGDEVFLYNASVNALANLYAGDTVDITVASVLGRVEVVSESSEGGATNKFQWTLVAQGTYGNQTPVV